MFKKIVMIVTVLLVLGLGVFLWSANREEQKLLDKQEKIDDARRPLLVKKHEIEQKLVDLEKQFEANKLPKEN